MNNWRGWRKFALLSTVCLTATVAHAQENTDSNTATDTQYDVTDVVMTVGTQIKGVQITDALPVSVLGEEQLEASNALTFEELLLDIPQAGAADFNSGAQLSNDARGDIASLNLRSIGADTSLVLVNGRRIVAHPQTQTFNGVPIQFVNMNAIPTSGLGRVEVLRDGASALYGSDAVAGVLNAVVRTDYEGVRASARFDTDDGGDFTQYRLGLRGGTTLNDDKTHLSFSLGWFDRGRLDANERDFASNADHRFDRRLPEIFRTETTDFRNNSSFTQFGEFRAGVPDGSSDFIDGELVQIMDGGDIINLTTSTGQFHLQPAGVFPNASQAGFGFGNGLEIDDGSSTSTSTSTGNGILNDLGFVTSPTRFNQNLERSLIPETERINAVFAFRHEFENSWEAFGDFILFDSQSHGFFGAPVLSTSNNFTIPANYAHNPFGPTTLENGDPNPARLDGLVGVPDEGYDIQVRRFRFLEVARRTIDVDITQWRALGGLRGNFGDWDWETAFGYSESKATDVGVLISRTLLFNELSRTDQGAYNIFNGPDELDPEGASRFTVDVTRRSKNTLTTGDVRVSNANLFDLWAGPVAVGLGVEWRRESNRDDRDDRLDGTISFTNPITGEFFESDLLGVSATNDFSASRNVWAAYAEVIIPLIEDQPLIKSFTIQAAARFEHYTDIDDSVLKPRVALSWFLNDWIQVRGAWSQGFRAPNLVQANTPAFTRFTNSQVDYTRETTQGQDDAVAVESRISGNPDLEPEESRNFSFGATFEPPFIEGLTLTVDYWDIRQTGTVGVLGRNNEIALDEFLLRTTGIGNPNVIRADATPEDIAATQAQNDLNGTDFAPVGAILQVNEQFLNLGARDISGIDINLMYDFPEMDWGDLRFTFNAAYLDEFRTEAFESILPALNDPMAAGNFDVGASGLNEVGFGTLPKWRFRFALLWSKNNWDAGISGRFVGPTTDDGTSVTIDGEEIFYRVGSFFTVDIFAAYEFDKGVVDGLRVRAGVRNLIDEDPPLFDNSAGFSFRTANPRGRQFFISAAKSF